MREGFVHLTVKSSFSLLEGMIAPKKLARVLGDRGEPACGVAELGNLFSAVEVSKHLPEAGVQPVLGAELWVEHAGQRHTVTLLVQNETGWKNLAKLVSLANLVKLEGRDEAVVPEDVLRHAAGLVCLSGSVAHGWGYAPDSEGRTALLERLQEAFDGRFYVQLERYGWGSNAAMAARQREGEARLVAWARDARLPPLATNDVRFIEAADREACEALLCIHDGTVLDDPRRRRLTDDHRLKTAAEMQALFADIPAATANTVQVALRCAYRQQPVDVKAMYMPVYSKPEAGGGEYDVNAELRAQAAAGLEVRLRDHVFPRCDGEEACAEARARYLRQLAYELDMIIQMGFPGYFLITSDFIRWAKGRGIPVGPGRGSGAGSLVAWALDITDLDPLRWGLYFERFLNPDRVSLPDFDIDFCQDRREEVIAYVRERFGADRVSQIITFGTLKARACIRDVGRVLGMGYTEVGQIAAFIPEGPTPPSVKEVLETDDRLKARYHQDENVQRLLDIAMQLEGCYRHASTHAAGVIITDRPIDEVCGLYVDPRSGMPATQVSMGDAEYCGLVKFDFLGLKTLTVIRTACDLVKQRHGEDIDILKIPLDDAPTFEMVTKGHTVGVFQIESAGMTELAKRMKADDLEALSALVALYRPGPMELLPTYLARRLGHEPVVYDHPLLEQVLDVTFGVAVYQEQVMQMARVLAGYTLGGADLLRRAMGKKKPEEMAKERAKFVAGAAETNGIDADKANAIFDRMETFAGYGFNKAHSLAYALISYQTAWLKAHHPLSFTAASMTYDRGNTDRLLKYKQDLERMGSCLLVPDVNASGVYFTVEDKAVRHALAALKGAGEEAMRRLVAEREAGGAFADIWDMLARLGSEVFNKKQLEVLAKGGALDAVGAAAGLARADMVENVDVLGAYAAAATEQKNSGQNSLFGEDSGAPDTAPYKHSIRKAEVDAMDVLAWEQEVLGFYLSDHPLSGFADELKQVVGYKPIATLADFAAKGGKSAKVAGVVLGVREVKTKSGKRMGIVSLSDPFGQGEVVIFPEAYETLGERLDTREPVMFAVRVQQDGERLRVSSEEMRLLKEVLATRDEVEITVPEAGLLPRVRALLEGAENGRTRVQLRLKTPQGEAVVKLPRGIAYSPRLVAGLRQMGVG